MVDGNYIDLQLLVARSPDLGSRDTSLDAPYKVT